MSTHLKATRDTLNSMWQRTLDVQEQIVEALNANTLRKPLTPEQTTAIHDRLSHLMRLHDDLLLSNSKHRMKEAARDGE